jgi:hypothetical protein
MGCAWAGAGTMTTMWCNMNSLQRRGTWQYQGMGEVTFMHARCGDHL